MFARDAVFVDVETTGGNAAHDRIIEVALLNMQQGELVSEWASLVNPGVHIPGQIQQLTGISNDMVRESPVFGEICHDIRQRLTDAVFIAHNARFDYGFLKNEFKRHGLKFRAPVLCTAKLSRKLFPECRYHNLDSIMQRHELTCSARHRAAGDARVLYDFMHRLYATLDHDRIDGVITGLLRRPSLPPALTEAQVDELPETPGVYLFYDAAGTLLYTGKSINIRARVLSHFAGDHRSSRDMKISQNLATLECLETAGELGALLHEARIIKQALPVYNRRLRRHERLVTIHWDADAMDSVPVIMSSERLDPASLALHYGLFKTNRQAKDKLRALAAEQGLCEKLLGLAAGPGACFAYHLRRCRGACVGKESALQHRIRLLQALLPLRNRVWPFAGRIGIREISQDHQRTDIHVFENWCYLGTAHHEAELDQLNLPGRGALMFNLDTYRILNRYLNNTPRPDIINIKVHA